MGFPKRYQHEAESVEGRIEFYHYLKLNYTKTNIDISEQEFSLLKDFVKDNIDLIRDGEQKGLQLYFATYVIGSGDRIRIEDFVREICHGSRAGPSGEYFRKSVHNPEDYSEEEYFALLCKEPYYLEHLTRLQSGCDYLKARIP